MFVLSRDILFTTMKRKPFLILNKEINLLHIASAIIIFAGLSLLLWFFIQSRNGHDPSDNIVEETPEENQVVCAGYRVIDGICVLTEEEINPKLVVVMIENHLDARPQSGLARAAVVYEAPVEANYSRFMAIFPVTENIGKVGPVRSARPYYLDWVREYGMPMYMHVGGSDDALTELKNGKYFDFNEFYRGNYFWRSRDRFAPHNAYTSSENWNKGWEDYGKETYLPGDESWKFGEISPCTATCTMHIVASFLPPVYQAEWKYSTTTEKYFRHQLKKPHVDQDGTQILADTLVVQRVQTQVLDQIGRIEMDTIGSGEAIVFTKGNMTKGTWKKTVQNAKTRFFDSSNNEIPFTPGKIWIEVVNQVGSVEYE